MGLGCFHKKQSAPMMVLLTFFKETVMEDELFRQLYRLVESLAIARRKRQRYCDGTIVLVYFWAVLHDRPVNWGTDGRNWPVHLRPAGLPSASTMSRRLRTCHLRELLPKVESMLRPAAPAPLVKTIDAKPLPIGCYSKDPDARW